MNVFKEQIEVFKEFLLNAAPNDDQNMNPDFTLAVGELFALVAYGQLILENSKIYNIDDDIVDQIFDCMVRDFSKFALQLYGKPSSTDDQMDYCMKMIKKPAVDEARYQRVWENYVYTLKDTYEMKE